MDASQDSKSDPTFKDQSRNNKAMSANIKPTTLSEVNVRNGSSSSSADDGPLSEKLTVPIPEPSTPQDQQQPLAKVATDNEDKYVTGRPLLILSTANCLAVLLIAMDVSILGPALSRVTDDFHTIEDIGWWTAAYLMTNSTFQPLTGKFFTYFPLKLTYYAFMVVFAIGSIICATAVSSAMLIIGRAVQGIGGAGIMNGSLTQLGLLVEPNSRMKIMGIAMSFFGLGQIIGPLVGGALTNASTWRWCFWINLFVQAVIIFLTVIVRFPVSHIRPKYAFKTLLRDFDVLGFVLFAPAVIMLLMALQWGGTKFAWSSSIIIGLFCGSGVSVILFVIQEYFAGEHAMIPASIVGKPIVAFSCITAGFSNGAVVLNTIYLPLWFQVIKAASPIQSAVDLLPTFITQTFAAAASGALTGVIGFFTPLAIIGGAFIALGIGLMTTFTMTTGAGQWIGFQIITGVGRGLSIQQPIQAAQAAVERRHLSTVNAVVMFGQFFGTTIFIGIGQTVFINLLSHFLRVDAPDVNPRRVTGIGATEFRSVVPEQYWNEVLLAYNEAITKTFFLAMGVALASIVTACGMGWKRIHGKKAVAASKA